MVIPVVAIASKMAAYRTTSITETMPSACAVIPRSCHDAHTSGISPVTDEADKKQ